MSGLAALMTIIILILAGGSSGCTDTAMREDLSKQQTLYCQMTGVYIDTDGQHGWPDYNYNRDEVCNE